MNMAASKKPTLNDFLKKGKKPPTKGKKAPPDYDYISDDMGYTKPTKKNPPKKIVNRKAEPGLNKGVSPKEVKRLGKR